MVSSYSPRRRGGRAEKTDQLCSDFCPRKADAAVNNNNGEQKANLVKYRFMARRPKSETIVTWEQLAEFTRQLQGLSDDGVERIYETTYRERRFDRKLFHQQSVIQQLVAAWRVLRKN